MSKCRPFSYFRIRGLWLMNCIVQLRSVNKKKKKTKRSKSKKIRRIKDSSSDESESDSSFYSSSSEDDYRREKRRSKVSKKKKKRSRKRYSSSDSDDDDIHLKKRSKRKDQHVVTKKKKKSRRRRYSSSSSTSSDDDSESDGVRRTREKGRVNDGSEEPDECWQVEDDEKKNSKRLKSIVVVTYNYDDGGERKEDMVGDDESDENMMVVDDQRDGEATLSSPTTGAHDDNRRIGYDEYNSSETSKASHQENPFKDDDLEAILKKRALENLKRFRGEAQRNGTVSKGVSSVSEGETLQTESDKFEEPQERLLMEQELCVSEGDKDPETAQVDNVKESGTGLADLPSQQDQQPGDTAKVKAGPGISSCTTTKRKLIRPVLGQTSLNLASSKEADGCQDAEAESINGKSCPGSSLALATKNVPENIEPRKVTSRSPSHAETETLDEDKEESQSEHKTNDETKDESQYEQKTMTVMRGGEMVQVNFLEFLKH